MVNWLSIQWEFLYKTHIGVYCDGCFIRHIGSQVKIIFAVIKFRKALSFRKTGNKNLQLVLQHWCKTDELKSDVARFTTHVQTCWQPDLLQNRFDVGGKTRAQHRYLTRFAAMLQNKLRFFVARFTLPLVM